MNVRQNLSVLFYLKRKKITSDLKIPIYVRITIDGLRDEFAFGYKVLGDHWNEETKLVTSGDPKYKTVNKQIGQTISDIGRHFDLIQAKNGIATPQAVKQSYLTPLNGEREINERKQNFEISEAIDEMINAYISHCHKIKKACQDL